MMNPVVMMLRVWAMYNRSNLILQVLLTLFFLEIISTLLVAVIYSNPRSLWGKYLLNPLYNMLTSGSLYRMLAMQQSPPSRYWTSRFASGTPPCPYSC